MILTQRVLHSCRHDSKPMGCEGWEAHHLQGMEGGGRSEGEMGRKGREGRESFKKNLRHLSIFNYKKK